MQLRFETAADHFLTLAAKVKGGKQEVGISLLPEIHILLS
jgi:hypothetical protein